MKDYDKNKGSSYLKYWNVNNQYRLAMWQKCSVNGFKWADDISKFNDDFIENYNENNIEGYFLEVAVQYPKYFHQLCNDLPFFPERMRRAKVENL